MAFLTLINCVLLTYGPLFVLMRSTVLYHLHSSEHGMRAAISSVIGYFLCSCLKLVVYASVVPISEDYSLTSELIKESVQLLDVWAMRYVLEWKWGRAQDQRARVMGLGFGWAVADAVLAHFLIFVLNAAGAEFTWVYIQRAIAANFTIFEWVAFGYFVWLTVRKENAVARTVSWLFIALRVLSPILLHELGLVLSADEWTALILHGGFTLFYVCAAK